jgi:hypothetical protein
MEPSAYLVLGEKILREIVLVACCLPARFILLRVGSGERESSGDQSGDHKETGLRMHSHATALS